VLGKSIEYFDDYYVFRHVVNEPFNQHFAELDFEKLMSQTAKQLGLDSEAINIDGEPRDGKFASPICFPIKVPSDVRVLYQTTDPYGDYTSYYHELGHGMHFGSVEADRPYHERVLWQITVAEIFSTLFETLATDPIYLEEEAGISTEIIEQVGIRQRFMDLYFLTFYGANSMMKIRFWGEDLSVEEADRLYAELYRKYTNLHMPGIYWQTHHVAGMSILYAPSYLIANIRKSELIGKLRSEFGQRWWKDPKAGEILREQYMGPGTAIDLGSFSSLDTDPYFSSVMRS
jgi:oligoendopeptidase F